MERKILFSGVEITLTDEVKFDPEDFQVGDFFWEPNGFGALWIDKVTSIEGEIFHIDTQKYKDGLWNSDGSTYFNIKSRAKSNDYYKVKMPKDISVQIKIHDELNGL